jgi:hypothetical protein
MHSGELLEQALRLSIAVVLPIAAMVGGAALVIGLLAYKLGLSDSVVVVVARAAVVLALLTASGAPLFGDVVVWSEELWAQIGEIGRGAP